MDCILFFLTIELPELVDEAPSSFVHHILPLFYCVEKMACEWEKKPTTTNFNFAEKKFGGRFWIMFTRHKLLTA